jgi:CRP-like cAMP-binding protein
MLNNSRQMEFYSNLSAKQIQCLSKQGDQVQLSSGDILFVEGDLVENLYMLIEGQLAITKNVNGQEIVLTILQPGAFTDEISLLAGKTYIVNAHALCKSHLFRFKVDTFSQKLFRCFPISSFIFLLFLQGYKLWNDLKSVNQKVFQKGERKY